jgi:hypothetical protein
MFKSSSSLASPEAAPAPVMAENSVAQAEVDAPAGGGSVLGALGLNAEEGGGVAAEEPSWALDEEEGAGQAASPPSGPASAGAEAPPDAEDGGVMGVGPQEEAPEGAEAQAPEAEAAEAADPAAEAAAEGADAEAEAAAEEEEGEEEEGEGEIVAEEGVGEVVEAVAEDPGELALSSERDLAAQAGSGAVLVSREVTPVSRPSVEASLAGAGGAGAGLAEGIRAAAEAWPAPRAVLDAGLVPEAPDFTPEAPANVEIGWMEDAIPDVPRLDEALVTQHSEGGDMVMSVGPEPMIGLVEDFDPIRLAETGMEAAAAMDEATAALWDQVIRGPGAEVVKGVDLDVEIPLSLPDLGEVEAAGADLLDGGLAGAEGALGAVEDLVGPLAGGVEGALGEAEDGLVGGLGQVLGHGQDLQEQIVGGGWETIQNAQSTALEHGQAAADALLEQLGVQQLADHQALLDLVTGSREDITAMWDLASGQAWQLLTEGEVDAQAIRDEFESIIDDLPSIPFIDDIIDEILDEMLDVIFDSFDAVQGTMNDVYDSARGAAEGLIQEAKDTALTTFETFQETMEEDVGGFFTETIPDLAGDVADTAQEVATDVGGELEGVADQVVDGVTDLAEEAGDGLEGAADLAAGIGGDALDVAKDLGGDALDGVKDFGEGALDTLSELDPEAIAGMALEEILEVAGPLLELGGAAPTWLLAQILYAAIQAQGAARFVEGLSDEGLKVLVKALRAAGVDLGEASEAGGEAAAAGGRSVGAGMGARGAGPAAGGEAGAVMARGGKVKGGKYPAESFAVGDTVKYRWAHWTVYSRAWGGLELKPLPSGELYPVSASEELEFVEGESGESAGPGEEPQASAPDPGPTGTSTIYEDTLGEVGVPLDVLDNEVIKPALIGILGRSTVDDITGWFWSNELSTWIASW